MSAIVPGLYVCARDVPGAISGLKARLRAEDAESTIFRTRHLASLVDRCLVFHHPRLGTFCALNPIESLIRAYHRPVFCHISVCSSVRLGFQIKVEDTFIRLPPGRILLITS